MICLKCQSSNVNVQMVTETKMKNAHHGIIWWAVIGWWWIFVKWLFFTLPALLAAIFIPRRKKVVTKTLKMCVCQNCGNSWKA